MIGGILIKVAFICCVACVAYYYQHHRNGNPAFLKLGRALYLASVALILVSAGLLLYLIVSHRFEFAYVWNYSSRELSASLLISTFYAGQEGSFMLWCLYTSLIGIFLMRYTSRRNYEAAVMSVFGLVTGMLLLMLIVKNPFAYVWENWPGQVEVGFVPANGRGLNPLLQNYWMVIHPQVLFTGFSAMSVPFVFAVAGMMKRDYMTWIKPATPWIVFGALQLGTGIIMGGFWAYETLGWGGYWGWDPVENSSLVPWLISLASIHTMLSQRKTGAFVKTNLALAMLCFLTVLYSTFLTRSGVLGDTSVHSFVDPGMWAYWLLVLMISMFTIIGFGLLVVRMREMPHVPVKHAYLSREFALFLGSASLAFAALFVTVGTSSPIITQIFMGKTTTVDISFYVATTLPLGIAIGVLSGIGQLLWWTRSVGANLFKDIMGPVAVSLLATIVAIPFGLDDVLTAIFVFGAFFSLFANLLVGWKIIKGSPKYAGGAIAHVGIALMFLGFVTSEQYDVKQTLSLPQSKPVEAVGGYTLTYAGYRPLDNEKFEFMVNVEKEGKKEVVAPIMYYSSYTEGLMRNPDILNLKTRDFYVAPLSLEERGSKKSGVAERVQLIKGQTKRAGQLTITFVEFDFPVDQKAAMLEQREVTIGARLIVRSDDQNEAVEIVPRKVIGSGAQTDSVAVFRGSFEFAISSMKPNRENTNQSSVEIAITDISKRSDDNSDRDVLVVEASIKPLINLVWSGVLMVLLGFVITIVRRVQEATATQTSL